MRSAPTIATVTPASGVPRGFVKRRITCAFVVSSVTIDVKLSPSDSKSPRRAKLMTTAKGDAADEELKATMPGSRSARFSGFTANQAALERATLGSENSAASPLVTRGVASGINAVTVKLPVAGAVLVEVPASSNSTILPTSSIPAPAAALGFASTELAPALLARLIATSGIQRGSLQKGGCSLGSLVHATPSSSQ